jgi:hypothetical protein
MHEARERQEATLCRLPFLIGERATSLSFERMACARLICSRLRWPMRSVEHSTAPVGLKFGGGQLHAAPSTAHPNLCLKCEIAQTNQLTPIANDCHDFSRATSR